MKSSKKVLILKNTASSILMRFGLNKIKSKFLILFIFLILLPTIIISAFIYKNSSDALYLQSSEYTLLLMQQLNSNISSFINQMERQSNLPLLEYKTMSSDVQKILKNSSPISEQQRISNEYALRSMFINIKYSNDYIDNIMLYANDGNAYSFYDEVAVEPDYTKTEWFQKTQAANGEAYFISPHVFEAGKLRTKTVFSIARQLKDFSTLRQLGIIVIDADINAIADPCQKINLGSGSNVIITDGAGNMIYSKNTQFISSSNKLDIDTEISGASGVMTDHIQSQTVQITWYTSKEIGWKFFGIAPVSEINKGIAKIQQNIYFFYISLFIFALIFFASISFGVIKPINRLRDLMKTVDKGNFDISIKVNSNDEIKELGDSFNAMIAKINELVNKVYTVDLAKKQAELNALQSQINPHYLYNTLESIRMMAAINDDVDVMNMIAALGDSFRYIINISNEVVTVADEINHINNYLMIQKMRYQDRISYKVEIDPDIVKCKILKLILQPIVENSILHGLENKVTDGHISVSGYREGDNIIFRISDDGAGIPESQLTEIKQIVFEGNRIDSKQFIGLTNIYERLKIYFDDHFTLDIASKPGAGTTVTLKVPSDFDPRLIKLNTQDSQPN